MKCEGEGETGNPVPAFFFSKSTNVGRQALRLNPTDEYLILSIFVLENIFLSTSITFISFVSNISLVNVSALLIYKEEKRFVICNQIY